jgi:hypothetical protein
MVNEIVTRCKVGSGVITYCDRGGLSTVGVRSEQDVIRRIVYKEGRKLRGNVVCLKSYVDQHWVDGGQCRWSGRKAIYYEEEERDGLFHLFKSDKLDGMKKTDKISVHY